MLEESPVKSSAVEIVQFVLQGVIGLIRLESNVLLAGERLDSRLAFTVPL